MKKKSRRKKRERGAKGHYIGPGRHIKKSKSKVSPENSFDIDAILEEQQKP